MVFLLSLQETLSRFHNGGLREKFTIFASSTFGFASASGFPFCFWFSLLLLDLLCPALLLKLVLILILILILVLILCLGPVLFLLEEHRETKRYH